MFIEIDMMAEEEDFLDHLYMDEQLYLQSIFGL